MANEEHLERLECDVDEWNRWRREHPEIRPDLSRAKLIRAKLSRVNLSGGNLTGVNLSGGNLTGAILHEAILVGANLTRTDLSGANLKYADLSGTNLSDANLSGTDLSRASLDRAFFYRTDLKYADLRWGNLNSASLKGSNLDHADLSEARLIGADFSEARLRRTRLNNARLNEVNFSGSDLSNADLTNADLTNANLTNANLSRVVLRYTSLNSTQMVGTILGDLDLRTVKGLETVIHRGPSHLSINTLYLSHGNIPEIFVRGTGAPDLFIEYIHSLVTTSIQYHSLFLSHSHHDQAFTRRLYNNLQNSGVRCWFAPHDLRPGTPIVRGIEEAIYLHEKLLLVLSHHAVMSNWVQQEVEVALYKETTSGQEILFPIRLDNIVLESDTLWAKRLRQRHIGDFTNWQEEAAYQEAFGRLLRDLKVNKASTG